MVISIIFLRLKQMRRVISSVSWPYRLVILCLSLLAIVGTAVKASQDEGSLIISGAFLLIMFSLHWFRPDYQFLRIYFPGYKLILFTEYALVSLPMLVGLMFSSYSYLALVYILALTLLLRFIQPSDAVAGKAQPLGIIPSPYFEWKSGLRKYFYPLLIIWLLGIVFSFQMAGGILSVLFIGLISLGFYDQCETESILMASQQNSSKYLWSRIKGLFLIAGTLYLPLFVLFTIFHLEHWYILAILILVTLSYQLYALTIKYAFYEPNSRSGKNTVLLSLGALVFVLPFILPAIWVLTVKLYFQSLKKLNFYLHDFS